MIMLSIPDVPLDAKAILEAIKTHKPELYAEVMCFAAKWCKQAFALTYSQSQETQS